VRLGLRLSLGFFLMVGLATFFVLRIFVNEVKPSVRQALESTLVDAANFLAVMAAPDVAAGDLAHGTFATRWAIALRRDPNARVWQFPKRALAFRVTITDPRGVVVFDSRGQDVGRDYSRWNDVYRTLQGRYGARSSPEHPGDEVHSVMYVAAPIFDPDEEAGAHPGTSPRLIGVLTLSQPNRAFEPFVQASQDHMIRRGAWLIALSALIAAIMTWWLVAGIRRLNRYAQAVTAGQPVPPPPPRRDELGDLGQALEAMRKQLEGKAYVEHYVQSLTHELKGPLAAIRGAAELLAEPLPEAERQRFVANIQGQEQRLTETIDKLLTLAEVEHHGWLRKREVIEPAALLEAVIADATPRAQAAAVTLTLEASAALPTVLGDAYLLRQALGNLVDNALAFSAAGGSVTVSAAHVDGTLALTVRDHGSGVPDYALARVFERFYSLPRPTTGTRSSGLGLPFVREVARLHGGSAALDNAADGGARASLRLPT
jgi:two-component system, OmpR family, sensor histidine kinase CreC